MLLHRIVLSAAAGVAIATPAPAQPILSTLVREGDVVEAFEMREIPRA